MMEQKYYRMTVAGCERDLPLCPLDDQLMIAGFVILGDTELTSACARELLSRIPDCDYMLTAETKGIPLVQEMARMRGDSHYIVARKGTKLYMRDVLEVAVRSITTDHVQHLYLDGSDADRVRGKRILIVDDVISLGDSIRALEELVTAAGGTVAGRATILAEGRAADREDIVYLEKLPLFDQQGNPL